MKSKKKDNRGGYREGAGRKSGKKAFVKVGKKEATKVMRIPVSKVDAVKELLSNGSPPR